MGENSGSQGLIFRRPLFLEFLLRPLRQYGRVPGLILIDQEFGQISFHFGCARLVANVFEVRNGLSLILASLLHVAGRSHHMAEARKVARSFTSIPNTAADLQ